MTTPVHKFNGQRVVLVLQLMRAVAREWRTAHELSVVLGMKPKGLRNWLTVLANTRALKVRHRSHEVQEDGDKLSGPMPREYKLSSKWSELR